MDKLSVALKEWDIVISAMLAGTQVVVLRKGGILEAENEFELEHRRFLFYPTFVHQDAKMVRAGFLPAGGFASVREEPETIEIRGYGEVAKIFEVRSRGALEELEDLHMWGPAMLDMRFGYRPEKPLYLVVVRAFRLPAAVRIKNTMAYAGCKSWVPLEEEVSVEGSVAAVEEGRLRGIVERVERTFG